MKRFEYWWDYDLFRVSQRLSNDCSHVVFVFLNKSFNIICYCTSIMANDKWLSANFWVTLPRPWMTKHLCHGVEEFYVSTTSSHSKLVVQQLKDWWISRIFDHVDRVLVIFECDTAPFDTFIHILFLLKSKHMLVELLLQLFICVVNAQLLKRIRCKYFEAKNIKKSDELQIIFLWLCLRGPLHWYGSIDFLYNPRKDIAVELFA